MKLTPTELLEISREITLAFAPDFSIKKPEPVVQYALSSQDMFAISEEIRQEFAPKASDRTPELMLLPVDTEHLYAYWNLDHDKPDTSAKKTAEQQLTLRIYALSDKNADMTKTTPWFDVAIADSRTHHSALLAMQTQAVAYRATLGKRYPDNSLTPLAYSNVTLSPQERVSPTPIKDNLPVLAALPTFISSRETSSYRNNRVSGQTNRAA